jgi:threonine dehydratase
MTVSPPTAADVDAAAAALAGRVVRTPLLAAPALGPDVHVKAELFQRSGAFKLRGALHRLDGLSATERSAGVVTVSAGNHARALAQACRDLGVRMTALMWEGASAFKIDAVRALGGTVDLSSADAMEAFAAVPDFVARTGATYVHPFDDAAVIAGAGTVGLEIVEDLPEVACVVVPVGGGGLISGIALAVKRANPRARIVAVEPERAATLSAAFDAGGPVQIALIGTAADALAPPSVGALNFAVCRELVDDVVRLSEDDLAAGLRFAYAELKLACEAGGAAAIAAVATGAVVCNGPTAVIASGGNITREALVKLL